MRIVLISCVSKKLSKPAKAEHLYVSPLFRYALAYARSRTPDAIYILSAKYGLVTLGETIAPYNETLNTQSVAATRAWAKRVLKQLQAVSELERDEFIVLAGERYRRFLLPALPRAEVPLKGLGLGRQLQFLKRSLV